MSFPFLAFYMALGLLVSLILMTGFLGVGARIAKMERVPLYHLVSTAMVIGVWSTRPVVK